MIEVKFNKEKNKVTAKGHAGTGPEGHDLVCAAVSILLFTLANDVKQLSKIDHKHIRRPKIVLEKGDAKISVDTVHGHDQLIKAIFVSICNGFQILAMNYPDVIKYTVL